MIPNFLQKYSSLNANIQTLLFQKNLAYNNNQVLEQEIKKDKNWLNAKEERTLFVDNLQQYLHQKNILAFNQMLSAFVEDVLEKDKKIELELFTSHNLPALNIHAVTNEGTESIMDGSGGSLANIVSTGLRIISIARSPHRKFLLLDEADCWIKPERIELFANVVGKISTDLNIQIVMISHHSSKYFEKYGKVIELKKNGGKIEANTLSTTPFETENNKFITKMRLQNLMSHEDTVIDFHPNVTCIVGENDIGKSVIGSAFRALIRADSNEGFIRHKQDFAAVTIDFDNEFQAFWQRNRKTSQTHSGKVLYQLFQNSQLINKEYNANECPSFIYDKLNIKTIDKIDINLTHQKSPTFLLDKATSSTEKVKILSLGKESFIVQKMSEKIKKKESEIKKTLSNNEVTFNSNFLILNELQKIDEYEEQLNIIQENNQQFSDNQQLIDSLSNIISNLDIHSNIANISKINTINDFNITDTFYLNDIINSLSINKEISNIDSLNLIDLDRNLINYDDLNNSINTISLHKPISLLSTIQEKNFNQELNDTTNLYELINNLSSYKNYENVSLIKSINADFSLIDSNSLSEMIKEYLFHSKIQKESVIPLIDLNIDYQETNQLNDLITSLSKQIEINNLSQVNYIDNNIQLQDLDLINDLIINLNNAKIKSDSLAISLTKIKDEEKILNEQLTSIHQDLKGLCPCCGNPATIEQLTSH